MGNYLDPAGIDNWPSGYDAADKTAKITEIEQLIEKILGTHFYSKTFDIELNGNGKNRLFLPLEASVLTVTQIKIFGIALETSWYDYDANGVYLDLTTSGSGVGDPELYYALLRAKDPSEGLFPRGHNNIRVKGTYGYAAVPKPITELCKILVKHDNDDSLYTSTVMASEKIGDYSYTVGGKVYEKVPVVTGIFEADKIIAIYRRQKKPKIMAP